MATYEELERRLTDVLHLERAPVAVTFCGAEPAGITRFSGRVPSGCTFWKLAAGGTPFFLHLHVPDLRHVVRRAPRPLVAGRMRRRYDFQEAADS